MSGRDWVEWHRRYEDPGDPLSRRLACVQRYLEGAIEERPGRVRVVSLCAGQGRDVIGVLAGHPRRDDVIAALVELDPVLAADASAAVARAGLDGAVEVRIADAALSDTYVGIVPADIVLACGIFGNIVDDDIKRTIEILPQLCAPSATVIWTRHSNEPDLTPAVRGWLADSGFAEIAVERPDDSHYGVGVARLSRAPEPLVPGVRWFTFIR
jgi:hypothetical protein